MIQLYLAIQPTFQVHLHFIFDRHKVCHIFIISLIFQIKRREIPRPQKIDPIGYIELKQEEPERQKCTKNLDIGRIMIEEIPEEKQEILKPGALWKGQAKPKFSHVAFPQHKVEYSKNLDIGFTDIEERSKQKKQPKVHGKEKTTLKPVEVSLTRHEVVEFPRITEDIVKVGKLDVSCLEKQITKSTIQKEKSLTCTDGTHKVIIKYISREADTLISSKK